ncbi:MAG: hypothetical protein NZV14_10655 [Bryobacteraceae bacterium]|nr:hypothetical protein [Bryobacteraceae bacterium]MDW8378612.1 hypothetical protein [Bryobacterales bacterium]
MLKKIVVSVLGWSTLGLLADPVHAQVFSVTPSSVTFTTPSNTQTPAATALVVVNSTSAGFTVSVNQPWLSTTVASSVITVSVNPQVLATLAPGQYNGVITVTPAASSVPPVNVPVTLTIGTTGTGSGGSQAAAPAVSVSPNNLSFQSQGGAIPASQVFTLTAPVGSSYQLTPLYASGAGWLAATPSSGTTSATTTPITVSVNPAGLAAGTYSAAIQVQISNQLPQVVLVTFAVGSSPAFTISPNVVNFNFQPGQTAPANQTFTITASQPGVAWVAFLLPIAGGAWLNLPVNNGTATPSSQVSVGVNASVIQSLQPGIYSTLIAISLTIQSQPQYVLVTLQVGVSGGGTGAGTGAQGVTFSPASLTFNVVPGQNFPQPQQVTINAPQAFDITATASTDSGGTWLAVGPGRVVLAATTTGFTTNISVGLIATQIVGSPPLPNGEYTGRITITQTGTSTVLATIPVRLIVGPTTGTGTATGTAIPSQLTFTFQANGTNPPTQILTLLPPGGVSASYSAQIVGPGGATVNWLQLDPATGTAPGAMAVRVINVGTLGPATYTATINITFSGSSTPVSVPVTLIVQTTPSLRTNINQVTFNYQAVGGVVPPGQGASVEVTSTGGATQPVTFQATAAVTTGTGWLTVTPSSGTTPATVTISINAGNLQPGTYTGNVTLTYPGGQNVIPITLNVTGSIALLNSSATNLAFLHTIGSANPSPQNLTIQSTGTPVNVTPVVNLPSGQSWLSVTPLQANATPATFQVSVNPLGLAEGIYYGSIVFTALAGTAANSPLVVPVALNVTGSAALVITPGPLTFTQFQGGAAPPPQTLNIASSGALLSYLAEISILTGSGWLSINVNSGITPGTIQVTVNGAQLPQGTYTGSIIIRSQGATNSPQVIPVTLNVVAPPTVTATPSNITFNANTNNVVTPSTQTIEVRSSGVQITYQVQASVGSGQPQWLVVTPSSGTTPGAITVSVNLAGLQPGVYNGTVTINTGLPQPITIPVQLNLQQVNPPVITAVTNAASFLPTAVAPGMIVAIFGQNLGPQNLVRLRLTPSGTVDTTLEGVRVTFDGIPAPLLYVRSDVLSAVVPYGIGGRAAVRLQVEHQGARSAELSIRVVDAAPAIFTLNQQGDGQGAIQNSDFSINGPANPAARGQFAIIYFTGEGATSPAGVDGVIASANLLRSPIARTEVRIGGQPAEVLYVGSVPTTVLGLAQVNVIVPPNAPTGPAVPVEVIVGGVASRPGVTMAVR